MKDEFGKEWILEKGIPIVQQYDGITLRALHYRLVSLGMPNTLNHYKRVISAMTYARWQGMVGFDDFDDHERTLIGETKYETKDVDEEIEDAKGNIEVWMRAYHLDRWSNQPYYVEVWIEKKALQGTFQKSCFPKDVALFPCKGYPSLTWLNEAKDRFKNAQIEDKKVVVIYFGDYDASGEDIPRSIVDNLAQMNCYIDLDRIALTEEQVIEMGLPPAPTKLTDTRAARWTGLGQVELDAIEPSQLKEMATEAIDKYFDTDLHAELKEKEAIEREKYQERVKEWVVNYGKEEED